MIALSHTKTLPHRAKRLIKSELRNRWRRASLKTDVILYESFAGNGMLCHPEAIFRHIYNHAAYKKYTHVWVLNDFDRYSEIIEEFKNNPRVKFVKYLTNEYYRLLATSKFLINNVSFPTQFTKREDQVYLNTWHGIPLKKMGYDITGRAVDAKNIVRNFLQADYLLSSSAAMTEEMYMGAFKLKNVFAGKIIEEGNPRIDRQFDDRSVRDEFNARLEKSGVSADDRKIILYAPTWKGESYFSPHNDASNLKSLVNLLESTIDSSKYRILVKAHQVVSESLQQIPSLKPYLVPNSMPTNVALGAAEVLITDYSSVFYDFLPQEKPVLFYIPDLEEYKQYRDLYIEPDELPGPTSRTIDELGELLRDTLTWTDLSADLQRKYKNAAKKYLPKDDGSASKRVAQILLGSEDNGYAVTRTVTDGKIKLLIYAGGMIPNGITTSAINLLDNINYDRYDVTVLCPFSAESAQQHGFSQINSNARVMFRFGTFNGSYVSNRIRLRVLKRGERSFGAKLQSQKELWRAEWKRCLGNATFDHMIDFSGYTPFWGKLFLHGEANKRSIWLHNDLAADAHRSISGNTPLKDGLFATFSIYNEFDNLVSVSQGLRDINESSLSKWAPEAKFSWSSNTVNAKKIRELAAISFKDNEKQFIDRKNIDPRMKSTLMGKAVGELLGSFERVPTDISSRVDTHFTAQPFFTFFSAGRLSPEKNHSRLIQAFACVHEKNPQTRLVIAGDGPLKYELHNEVKNLGLTESVKLVGHTKNPYQLMNLADVFVLSSDYEGQPMVLLEALVLGIPVITTSFGSVKGALPPNTGKIVPPSTESLAEAMLKESLDPSPVSDFDPEAYNVRAMAEFESVVNLDAH